MLLPYEYVFILASDLNTHKSLFARHFFVSMYLCISADLSSWPS